MPILQMTLLFLLLAPSFLFSRVEVGLDRLFSEQAKRLENKNIGLITNHTAIDKNANMAVDLFIQHQEKLKFKLKAFFAPEHGLFGEEYAGVEVKEKPYCGITVYSLFGKTRRPTKAMLSGIDLLVFDIQDIGSRTYTFQSTLYYVMEEAALRHIPVLVLDRPNPLGGAIVDGPMLEAECRSFIGYLNVPYVHGMTIGELACFFNEEYGIGCDLSVVTMRGWNRSMSFKDTGCMWVPTSPYIPESETPFFYPMTGLLGEMGMQEISIGIGYTLPFKVVAAPWIDAKKFQEALYEKKFPGLLFVPVHFRPIARGASLKAYHGVLILLQDKSVVQPASSALAIMATLKALYPGEFMRALHNCTNKEMFIKACGTRKILSALEKERCTFQELYEIHKEERREFMEKRKKYLINSYSSAR